MHSNSQEQQRQCQKEFNDLIQDYQRFKNDNREAFKDLCYLLLGTLKHPGKESAEARHCFKKLYGLLHGDNHLQSKSYKLLKKQVFLDVLMAHMPKHYQRQNIKFPQDKTSPVKILIWGWRANQNAGLELDWSNSNIWLLKDIELQAIKTIFQMMEPIGFLSLVHNRLFEYAKKDENQNRWLTLCQIVKFLKNGKLDLGYNAFGQYVSDQFLGVLCDSIASTQLQFVSFSANELDQMCLAGWPHIEKIMASSDVKSVDLRLNNFSGLSEKQEEKWNAFCNMLEKTYKENVNLDKNGLLRISEPRWKEFKTAVQKSNIKALQCRPDSKDANERQTEWGRLQELDSIINDKEFYGINWDYFSKKLSHFSRTSPSFSMSKRVNLDTESTPKRDCCNIL